MKTMKTILASITLMAFVVAAQAGDGKACCSEKTSTSTKIHTSTSANGSCCSSVTKTGSKNCKTVLMSPKAAEQAPKMIVASR